MMQSAHPRNYQCKFHRIAFVVVCFGYFAADCTRLRNKPAPLHSVVFALAHESLVILLWRLLVIPSSAVFLPELFGIDPPAWIAAPVIRCVRIGIAVNAKRVFFQ